MLMTFDVDGRVQFTRNPKALELVAGLGKLAVTRMSEISFDEARQQYFIRFVTGRFKGFALCWFADINADEDVRTGIMLAQYWDDFWVDHSPVFAANHMDINGQGFNEGCTTVLFRTYEDAVAIEVAFIDMLRERGIAVQ